MNKTVIPLNLHVNTKVQKTLHANCYCYCVARTQQEDLCTIRNTEEIVINHTSKKFILHLAQVASLPVHVPSLWHSLCLLPVTTYPSSHSYTQTSPSVGVPSLPSEHVIIPLSGSASTGHLTRCVHR